MQKTTPEAYLSATKLELVAANLELIEGKVIDHAGKKCAYVEYKGKMGKTELQFIALAIVLDDRVILATGTAAQKDFEKIKDKLKAAVLSLNLLA